MKKILVIAALVAMLASCGKAPKTLILYYSQGGTTETVAKLLQDKLGCDIEKIEPAVPYDGTYGETIDRGGKERDAKAWPELKPLASDVKSYDVIFIGFPVWFGTYANPIATLLETVDFSGKKIVPFCTFGSGGLDSSTRDMKAKLTSSEILPGYGVRAARIDAAEVEVERFLLEGGFIKGKAPKIDPFPAAHPADEAEAALFDEAVSTYPMIRAKAEEVSERAVPGGKEYLFTAKNLPMPGAPAGNDQFIKVYVLVEDGKAPVFTQVLR